MGGNDLQDFDTGVLEVCSIKHIQCLGENILLLKCANAFNVILKIVFMYVGWCLHQSMYVKINLLHYIGAVVYFKFATLSWDGVKYGGMRIEVYITYNMFQKIEVRFQFFRRSSTWFSSQNQQIVIYRIKKKKKN